MRLEMLEAHLGKEIELLKRCFMKKLGLLVIIMLGLAGCPDNSRNANPGNGQPGFNGIGNCVNCGFNPAVFSQAVSSTIPQAQLNITLAGDVNLMSQWAHMGQNPLFAYQGPVAISGTMNVTSVLPMGMCQLPPGQYQVRSISAGQYNMGVFQIPALEIVGPARMVVALGDGVILTNGNGVIIGFSALLIAQQGPVMNGGWGVPGGMGMMGCMDSVGVRF
jgi:hypothetical protein